MTALLLSLSLAACSLGQSADAEAAQETAPESPAGEQQAGDTNVDAGTEDAGTETGSEEPAGTNASPAETGGGETGGGESEGTASGAEGSGGTNAGAAEADAGGPGEEGSRPAGLPEGFPDIGVPFYHPAELIAMPSEGDPWVLEFVTDHELTIVNNTIANEFSETNGWQGVTREVNGQQTVTKGTAQGYLLVIAVAPERTDDFKTSLYYTLSAE